MLNATATLAAVVVACVLIGCTRQGSQNEQSSAPNNEQRGSLLVENGSTPAEAVAVDLSGLKGLRLGMGMGEVRELEMNAGGFDGGKFECQKRNTMGTCSVSDQSVADLPASILAQFVATKPVVPPRKVAIPEPYEATPDELRRLSVAELVDLSYGRDAARRVALRQQAHAIIEADNVFRLAYFRVMVSNDSYGTLRAAIVAKWGRAHESRTETLRNAMNAAFQSRIDGWSSPSAHMELREYCEEVAMTCLEFEDISLQEALSKAIASDAKTRARDL